MKKSTAQALLLLSMALLTSCSTIMNGTRQSIQIESDPSNAYVWVDRNYVGVTPIIVEMSRKDMHYVKIELDGFEPYEATFSRKLSKWVFGNIVFGGVIGLAVDALTGAIYTLTPDQVRAEMSSPYAMHTKNSSDSYVTIVMKPDPSWQKVGNLVAIK